MRKPVRRVGRRHEARPDGRRRGRFDRLRRTVLRGAGGGGRRRGAGSWRRLGAAGADRCPCSPELRQRAGERRRRHVRAAGISRVARGACRGEGSPGRVHLARRSGVDQPGRGIGPRRDQLRDVHRAPHHLRGTAGDRAPGARRLVPGLDRRSREFGRRPGPERRRGDRGDPHPGQGPHGLHQVLGRRAAAQRRRRADVLLLTGGTERDGRGVPPARGQDGHPFARPRGRSLFRPRRRRRHPSRLRDG